MSSDGRPSGGPAVTSRRQAPSATSLAADSRQIWSASSAVREGQLEAELVETALQAGEVLVEEDRHAADQLERLVQAEAVREGPVGGRQGRLVGVHEDAVEHEHGHGATLSRATVARRPEPAATWPRRCRR